MRRSKQHIAATTTTLHDKAAVNNSSKLWCSCQQPDDGRFMICCDFKGPNCKIWYHGDCVGITKSRGKRMERKDMDFICPMCSDTIASNTEANPSVESTELPPYTAMSPPSFIWNNNIEGVEFVQSVSVAYDEVVYWRRNLFLVPYGKAGHEFVQELAALFHSYGEASALECIALKAAMLLCTLLLQRPHTNASSKDFISCLQ